MAMAWQRLRRLRVQWKPVEAPDQERRTGLERLQRGVIPGGHRRIDLDRYVQWAFASVAPRGNFPTAAFAGRTVERVPGRQFNSPQRVCFFSVDEGAIAGPCCFFSIGRPAVDG